MEYQNYKPEREAVMNSYMDNSLFKPRHFYPIGFESTLEGIAYSDSSAPEQEFLERTLTDKKQVLKAGVKALLNELQERERLNRMIYSGVNAEILRTKNYLEEIRGITARSYAMDMALNFSRRRTQLEDRIVGLSRELHDEARDHFKTQNTLRLYLLKGLSDYWEFNRKMKHLGYGEHVEG
ncbi:MAG: hypothetical protein A3D92_02410 [Bacteroidetes bacterium RIFCSPHIGHO2_02_FULL_44_7]|nr:MAG: hypothetical protein A3D92_02410 [Bacteroidetes bacterium RIFCSPHIGHO2_02_FULL_44_7]